MKWAVDKEEHQYFDRELLRGYSFENGFVDAGAYVGDTVDSFFRHFPGWNGNYYCFEAEADIFHELTENIKKPGKAERITAYNYAVWKTEGRLKFVSENAGSYIGEAEGTEVPCCSLDKILEGKPVSFIKMDIEGAEKEALLGAEEMIKRNKPVLTICIYHKREDFFEIPLLIEEMVKHEYAFYIRQYRYGQSETVLYALPESRKKK